MDYTGNKSTGGISEDQVKELILEEFEDVQEIDILDGYIQNLKIGTKSNVQYIIPSTKKPISFSKGVIVNEGPDIEISGTNNTISYTLSPQISPVGSTTIPTGTYTLPKLLEVVQIAVNDAWATAGSTNTIELTIVNGFVNLYFSTGNSTHAIIPDLFLWLKIGNTANSGIINPDTTYIFPSQPDYINSTDISKWNGYNFDDTGRIFQGDMTVNGQITAKTLISDITVSDSQITLNLNAVNDNNATGIVLNNTTNTLFSGFLKQSNSNDFYIFANSSTQPTETGWIAENNGNLHLNQLLPQSINLINGTEKLFIDNTAIRLTSDNHQYKTNDGTNAVEITPSHIHLKYANNDRIRVNNTQSDIRSPDLSNYWVATDVSLLGVMTGADFRFEATATNTKLNSVDGLNNASVDLQNGNLDLVMTGVKRAEITPAIMNLKNPLDVAVVTIDSASANVKSPNNLNVFSVTNSEISMGDAGGNRLEMLASKLSMKTPVGSEALFIDGAGCVIQSPNGNRTISVANGQITTGDIGGTRTRIDDTETSLLSPNKGQKLTIDNSGLIFTDTINNVFRAGNDIKIGTDLGGYTFPLTRGTDGQVLKTNGVGIVTWQDPSGGIPSSIENGTSSVSIPVANQDIDITYGGILRGKYSGTASTMYSPDALTNIDINNADFKLSKSGQNRLLVNATTSTIFNASGDVNAAFGASFSFLYAGSGVANKVRMGVNATQSFMNSDDEASLLQMDDNETFLEKGGIKRWHANATDTFIRSPNNLNFIQVSNANNTVAGDTTFDDNVTTTGTMDVKQLFTLGDGIGAYNFPTSKGADGQILTLISGNLDWANVVATAMKNPSETAELQVLDGPILKYKVGAEFADRIRCDTSQNIIRGPGGASNMVVRDSYCQLSMNSGQSIRVSNTPLVEIKCSGDNRILINTTETRLVSPDELKFVSVQNTSTTIDSPDIIMNVNAVTRQQINTSHTQIFSPDTLSHINLLNSSLSFIKGGVNRIVSDGTESAIVSPDATGSFSTSNTVTAINSFSTNRFTAIATNTKLLSPDGLGTITLDNSLIKLEGDQVQINTTGSDYKLPTNRPTSQQLLRASNGVGDLEWYTPSPNAYFSHQTFGNATATTLTQNVYSLISSSSSSPTITPLNFALDPGTHSRFQYTGTVTQKFLIHGSVCMQGAKKNGAVAIFKNAGGPIARMCHWIEDMNPQALSVQCIVELAQNDYISLRIVNLQSSDAFTVADFQFTATRI